MEEFLPDLNVHPDFFVPFSSYKPGKLYLEHVSGLVPKNWRLNQDYFWTYVLSPKSSAPTQGWKIHVSAVHESARKILEVVTQVCVAHGTEFKFASDQYILRKLLSKNAARQAGGKFVTIYPPSVAVFETILEELYQQLKEESGPYILSDRQYKDSKVVFYRYGGIRSFSEQNPMGRTKSLILSDKFHFIEDQRLPRFALPEFVEDGLWGQQEPGQEAADSEENKNAYFGGRYEIASVIKFTNAGGIYAAKDVFSEEQVVIKEARPFVGTDIGGLDAITRLKKEYRLLEKIKDEAIAPVPYGWFEEWQHSFLAQEFVKGQSLREYCVHATKVVYPGCPDEETRVWLGNLVQIARDLIDKMRRLHRHDIVFGDLSTNNVIIDPETLALRIIDFEGAVELGVDPQMNIYTPGFGSIARRERKHVEVADDHFALGCIMLALVMPSSAMMEVKADYAAEALQMLSDDIGLPQPYIDCATYLMGSEAVDLDRCLHMLERVPLSGTHSLPIESVKNEGRDYASTVDAILSYNLGVMDLAHSYRTFPLGSQFSDALAIDHGVLGVALGLQKIRHEVPADLKQWLSTNFATAGRLPGLLNGLSGIAWAFMEMGMTGEAQRALRGAAMHRHLYQNSSLGYGLAGYGLANLFFWRSGGEAAYRDEAIKVADILCETAVAQVTGLAWDVSAEEGVGVGLNEGASGISLFLLYAYCMAGNARYLEVAQGGLDFDISCGGTTQHLLGFPRRIGNSRKILYPYLGYGSAGVGTVALRMYALTREERYLTLVNDIRRGVGQKYTIAPDLMLGLAGLGNYLLDAEHFTGDPSYGQLAARAASGLRAFEITREQGRAYPMSLGAKISCSYAAGSTGIALFLHRLTHGGENFHFMMDDLLDAKR